MILLRQVEIKLIDTDTGISVEDIFMWENLDELKEQVKTFYNKCMLIIEQGYLVCDKQYLTEEEYQIIYK